MKMKFKWVRATILLAVGGISIVGLVVFNVRDSGAAVGLVRFLLHDDDCRTMLTKEGGNVIETFPSNRNVSRCDRKGKDLSCETAPQGEETLLGGKTASVTTLLVYGEDADFFVANAALPSQVSIYIFKGIDRYVWAQANLASNGAVIQKQCTGRVLLSGSRK